MSSVSGSASPPVTLKTDILQLDQADYEKGVFAVTFPGPPPLQKTLYAEKQGLQIYHSWVYQGFETQAGIDAAKSDLTLALSTVRGYAEILGTSSDTFVIRSAFNDSIANACSTGADQLTLADMDEEGAKVLILQIRQQIGVASMSLGIKAAQELLKLIS